MITVEFNDDKFDKFIYTRLHTSNKIRFFHFDYFVFCYDS